jgi:hypothetical protein
MDTRDLPPELLALASDQQETWPEKTRDTRVGKTASGGGRLGGRRVHMRDDDDMDNIIQISTSEERR